MHKRYLLQAAAFNLGLVMRELVGRGTPRGLADAAAWLIFLFGMLQDACAQRLRGTWEFCARSAILRPHLTIAPQPVSSTGC